MKIQIHKYNPQDQKVPLDQPEQDSRYVIQFIGEGGVGLLLEVTFSINDQLDPARILRFKGLLNCRHPPRWNETLDLGEGLGLVYNHKQLNLVMSQHQNRLRIPIGSDSYEYIDEVLDLLFVELTSKDE